MRDAYILWFDDTTGKSSMCFIFAIYFVDLPVAVKSAIC